MQHNKAEKVYTKWNEIQWQNYFKLCYLYVFKLWKSMQGNRFRKLCV